MYRNECRHGVDNPHGKSKTEVKRMTPLAMLTVHNTQTLQNTFRYRTNGLKPQTAINRCWRWRWFWCWSLWRISGTTVTKYWQHRVLLTVYWQPRALLTYTDNTGQWWPIYWQYPPLVTVHWQHPTMVIVWRNNIVVFISVLCNGPWYTKYKTNYLHECIVLKNLFYTLKSSAHTKINFKITPTCFGPIGPSSGSTSFLSQSYHWYTY
jgi:hypothetical protein